MKTNSFPMRVVIVVAALGLLTGLRAADKKVDLTKLPPPSTKTALTFDKDIKPLLEKSCLKCHSGEKPKGKYVMESRDAFLKGGAEVTPAVKPGKSADSPAVHFAADLVTEMEMPPLDKRDKYPALTKDQIGVLRAWIDQGAK